MNNCGAARDVLLDSRYQHFDRVEDELDPVRDDSSFFTSVPPILSFRGRYFTTEESLNSTFDCLLRGLSDSSVAIALGATLARNDSVFCYWFCEYFTIRSVMTVLFLYPRPQHRHSEHSVAPGARNFSIRLWIVSYADYQIPRSQSHWVRRSLGMTA